MAMAGREGKEQRGSYRGLWQRLFARPAAPVVAPVEPAPPPRPEPRRTPIEELDRAVAVMQAHSTREGSPWDDFRDRYLALPDWYDATLDPFSAAYAAQQDRLWEWVAGRREYSAEAQEQTPEVAAQECIYQPAFYVLRERGMIEVAGKHIIATGHFLRYSGVAAGERVLEYGAGYGQTALAFARMGARVDTVDINPHFCRAVQAQGEFFKVRLNAFVGGFGDNPRPTQRYRLIFFYEAFHHCREFLAVIPRLRANLADDGKILLGGEPITSDPDSPSIPYPWGLRLDVENAAVVRWRGWYELGFHEDFLVRCFLREGFRWRRHLCEGSEFATLYEFRPRGEVAELEHEWLAPSDAATWHPMEAQGRWTQARSTFTVDARGAQRQLSLTGINHHPRPISVRLTCGSRCAEFVFPPRERTTIRFEAQDGDRLVIECTPVSPASYGSADTRLLGLFVEQIAQALPELAADQADPGRCVPITERMPPPADTAEPPDFEAAVHQHAPNLVRAAYKGLLRRDADPTGLQNYVHLLRGGGGSLDSMLHGLTQAEEFVGLMDERRPTHLDRRALVLPPADRRIAIFANCQGSNLARCMQVLTGKRPPQSTFVTAADLDAPQQLAHTLKQAIADHDTVVLQGFILRALDRIDVQLPMEKVVVLPPLGFIGFHPDMCGISVDGTHTAVQGPMGTYQSSIVFHAWQAGMSRQQALDLFCEAFFEQLGFFDAMRTASQGLLKQMAQWGLPGEALLDGWRQRGCFMHGPSHPKLFVLADLARTVLQRLGVATLPVQPEAVLRDPLAELPVCPVYPEIAQRLGIAGGYHFKGDSHTVDGKAPVQWFGLEEFIDGSFTAFETHPQREQLVVGPAFRKRFAGLLGTSGRWQPPPKPAARPESHAVGRHPYAALPARQFWQRAHAAVANSGMDPTDPPSFRLDAHTRIATGGSCFAQHIARHLRQRGFHYLVTEPRPEALDAATAQRRQYGVYSARYGNLYTARQLLQLFDRAYGTFQPAEPAWQRPDGRWVDPFRPEIEPEGFASPAELESARAEHLEAVRTLFETVEVFVFTLGLTEAWVSREDGAVFPLAPGVAAGSLDAERHAFVNFDTAAVLADLEAFRERLAVRNPGARLLLTVSPVPLVATYEDQHVLAASTYSKSVLRAAAGEFCRRHPQCGYFPAYEIVTGAYNRGGYFAPDLRSVTAAGVEHVMRLFFARFAGEGVVVIDATTQEQMQAYDDLICEEQRLAEGGSP